MWALLKKNGFFFVLLTILFQGVIFIPMHVSRINSENPLDLGYIFYTAQYIFWAGFLGVWLNEQIESKNDGYAFLKTLPVRDGWIALSKYVPAFLTVVVNVLFLYVINAGLSPGTAYKGIVLNYLSLIGGFGFVLMALAYLAVFGLGFSRIHKFLIVLWISVIVFPILYREVILPKTGHSLDEVVRNTADISWLVTGLGGAALFWVSFPLAVRLKRRIRR